MSLEFRPFQNRLPSKSGRGPPLGLVLLSELLQFFSWPCCHATTWVMPYRSKARSLATSYEYSKVLRKKWLCLLAHPCSALPSPRLITAIPASGLRDK
ncbi:hypothetical protein GGI42DRAFT_318534 [Trichoderma sp. SZMC 28013]